jgi:leucyl-tRNA synthetase
MVRTSAELVKEGVFTGAYAVNPFSRERIPIWAANFVLYEYGTGAIMSVPAHDQRDFEFAVKYGLPIRLVIQNAEGSLAEPLAVSYELHAGTLVNSGPFTGLSTADGKTKIAECVEGKGWGARTVNYRLRDWGVSRQRYWGTPIPIIYCETCGVVPVPESELPVALPKDVPFTGKGSSPLAQAPAFARARCPKCGGQGRRETDTMDTFVDSSWYFLRYCSPHETMRPVEPAKADRWMAVDQYVGGIEHAVLHLLYARFFTKAVRDLGLIKVDEPFSSLLTQGMVCKETYRCEEHGWLFPGDRTGSEKDGWRCHLCGKPVERGRVEKMSKSKKNIVDPEHLIAVYGADTARLFSLFAAPPEKDLEWSDDGVEGASRFLGRVWRLVHEVATKIGIGSSRQANQNGTSKRAQDLRRLTHKTIKKVTEDIGREFQFNTAVAALMEFVNGLYKFSSDAKDTAGPDELAALREAVETLLLLLSPFAPHVAEELWVEIGHGPGLARHTWPRFEEALLQEEVLTIPVQVNGKVRSKVTVPAAWSKEQVLAASLADGKVGEWIKGKTIKNKVYVDKRLVNIVLEGA